MPGTSPATRGTPGSSQPSPCIPGKGRYESHWVQEKEGRLVENPIVLVEALGELPVSPSGPVSGKRGPWRGQDGGALLRAPGCARPPSWHRHGPCCPDNVLMGETGSSLSASTSTTGVSTTRPSFSWSQWDSSLPSPGIRWDGCKLPGVPLAAGLIHGNRPPGSFGP